MEMFETESFDNQVQCGDLVMQTDAQDTKIQERDDRILGLLDQIANNMVVSIQPLFRWCRN